MDIILGQGRFDISISDGLGFMEYVYSICHLARSDLFLFFSIGILILAGNVLELIVGIVIVFLVSWST